MKQSLTFDAMGPPAVPGDPLQGAPELDEKRAHVRAKLALTGRFMLEDGSESVCETVDVSPTGILLKAEKVASPGERVVAYIDQLGRLEGLVVRTMARGFAIALSCTPRKTEKLASKIEWLQHHSDTPGDERRDSPRIERDGVHLSLVTPDHHEHPVELVDVSKSGMAFLTDLPLEIGDSVEIGAQKAKVARLFPGGAAVAFL